MKSPSRTIVSPKPDVGDPFEIVPVLPHTPGDGHLLRMEARYHGLLEAAPDAMLVANQVGGSCCEMCKRRSSLGTAAMNW